MKRLYVRLFSLSSIYSFGNLAQSAAAVLLLPLYTHYLTPADYGLLALMDLTILLIAKLVEPPLTNALNRFYYKPEYQARNGILLFNLLLVLVALTGVLAAAYWLSSDLLVRLLFQGDPALRHVVQVYAAILVLECLSSFLLTYIRLREWAKYFVFLSLSKLILSAGVIVYFLTVRRLGVASVIYGQIAGLCYLTAMVLPALLSKSTFRLSLSIVKEPLRFGFPMVISGYSNLLLESADRYILNVLTSVSSVGLYSFGYKIASLLNTAFIVPIHQAIFPTIYQIEGNPGEQKRFIATTATYYYLTGIFMALGVSLLARELIMRLASSAEFWPAWTVVPVIAFSYVQHGLGRFFKWGALLRNKTFDLSMMVLVSAIVNIGLNFLLIPRWGILGAAFATLVAYEVWNGLKLYYCARFFDLHFELGRLGHITVAGVGLYVLSLFVADTGSPVGDVLIKLLLLSTYPPLLLLTGFLISEEKSYLREMWLKAFAKLRAAM